MTRLAIIAGLTIAIGWGAFAAVWCFNELYTHVIQHHMWMQITLILGGIGCAIAGMVWVFEEAAL